jgi:hypothetical protein
MKTHILVLFIFFSTMLKAQPHMTSHYLNALIDSCNSAKHEINNHLLFKTYVDYGKYSLNSNKEWDYALYFDSDSIIRKSKVSFNYPEEDGYAYYYFNKCGTAIYTITAEFSGMNNGCSAVRYLTDEGILLFLDYIRRDDDNDGVLIEHIVRYQHFGTLDDNKPSYLKYDNNLHLDSLKRSIRRTYYLGTFPFPSPTEYILVRFLPPQKGESTIINANSVNLRKQPSVNSLAIAQLNVGDVVTVIDEKSEWYQVKFKEQTGYVHGDFLEPVEHEIKEK